MSKKKNNRSPDPTETVKRRLWVLAGGRCQLKGCNKYLLEDPTTNTKIRSFGELAHILASSPDGPRADITISKDCLREEDNLLLLCKDCHNVIDHRLRVEEYTIDLLKSYKQEHEARIKTLTGISPDQATRVLRLRGNIRGNSISLSPEKIRMAIFNNLNRYPHYRTSEYEVDIDLTEFPEETCGYWNISMVSIRNKITRFLETPMNESPVSHISVFAFARIPLLIYLGYELGDKIPVDVFEKQRGDGDEWGWDDSSASFDFTVQNHRQDGNDRAILILSLSGKIDISDLDQETVKNSDIIEIIPEGIEPNRGIFKNKDTIRLFRECLGQQFRLLEKTAKELLIIPAISLSTAVNVGREILRDITPTTIIYDRIGNEYKPTITIKR